jgi:hypothetical protein
MNMRLLVVAAAALTLTTSASAQMTTVIKTVTGPNSSVSKSSDGSTETRVTNGDTTTIITMPSREAMEASRAQKEAQENADRLDAQRQLTRERTPAEQTQRETQRIVGEAEYKQWTSTCKKPVLGPPNKDGFRNYGCAAGHAAR